MPFRRDERGAQILLITSRGTGRWIIPKGWPMEDKRPHRVAEIEAYEEAGVVGKALRKAIGRYDYEKDGSVPCRVVVFALPVEGVLEHWPEDRQRQRQWFGLGEASDLVEEPDLRAILTNFASLGGER